LIGLVGYSRPKFLQRVFDQLSKPGNTEGARDGHASRVIANCQAGLTDEEELIAMCRQPLGR
jgi:hypothetical protein